MSDELDKKQQAPLAQPDELPVVSRLVIEIRSDGSRTVARGAMEDVRSGEKVELHAEGATPMLLIGSLLKSLGTIPGMVLRASSLFLTGKKK